MAAISSSDNIIDSREVISLAEEFESDIELKQEEIQEKKDELAEVSNDEDDDEEERANLESELADLVDELTDLEEEAKSILEFRDDVENYHRGGMLLINEDYWAQYVQELAEDTGGVDTRVWPFNCIDWEQAAADLESDYTQLEWEGTTFYIQS